MLGINKPERNEANPRYYYTPSYIRYQIKSIFNILGVNYINVELYNTNKSIAYVTGINFGDIFNIPSFVNLHLNFERIQYFDQDELFFILAHECSHVYHNHMSGNIGRIILEKILKGENNENYQLVESGKAISALINKIVNDDFLPIDAAQIKHMELEADKFAVTHITYDLRSAVRCLLHLCNNHIERESHIWELFQVPFNIMTMGQRIEELLKGFKVSRN